MTPKAGPTEIRTECIPFFAIWNGVRRFEVLPTHTLEVGNEVMIREYYRALRQYTGRWISARVSYVTRTPIGQVVGLIETAKGVGNIQPLLEAILSMEEPVLSLKEPEHEWYEGRGAQKPSLLA